MNEPEEYPKLHLAISWYTPSNPLPPHDALIAAVLCHAQEEDVEAIIAHYGFDRIRKMISELDSLPLGEGWGASFRGSWADKVGAQKRQVAMKMIGKFQLSS